MWCESVSKWGKVHCCRELIYLSLYASMEWYLFDFIPSKVFTTSQCPTSFPVSKFQEHSAPRKSNLASSTHVSRVAYVTQMLWVSTVNVLMDLKGSSASCRQVFFFISDQPCLLYQTSFSLAAFCWSCNPQLCVNLILASMEVNVGRTRARQPVIASVDTRFGTSYDTFQLLAIFCLALPRNWASFDSILGSPMSSKSSGLRSQSM